MDDLISRSALLTAYDKAQAVNAPANAQTMNIIHGIQKMTGSARMERGKTIMHDRETIVKEWEAVLSRDPLDVTWDLIDDTVTLLKEKPEIVRCKDCKYRPTFPLAYGAEIDGKWCYWCEMHRAWKHDDWFCADGKRK